ncbi:hypothetical protein BDV11DRAFT_215779 [Aspergillus similis]
MSPNPHNPPLNPTVDEVRDERDSNDGACGTDFRLSWPQICTHHDSVLSSHLDMLRSLKGQVSSDPDAYRLISSMIERTQKLVMQFEGIKKHIVSTARSSGSGSGSSSGPRLSSDSTSRMDEAIVRKRKKRNRISNDVEPVKEPQLPVREVQPAKRKRVDSAIPGADQDVRDVMPVSLETEDISDEVQRRLKIKEEQRRKRDAKPEKRKRGRDSLASNASTSSLASSKPRKKYKLSERVGFPALSRSAPFNKEDLFLRLLSHSPPNPSNTPPSLPSAMAYRNIFRRFYHKDHTPTTSSTAYHSCAQGQDNQSRPVFHDNRNLSASGTAFHPHAQGQGNQPRPNSTNNRNPPTSDGAANPRQRVDQSLHYTSNPNNIRPSPHPTAVVQPRNISQEPKKGVSARASLIAVERPTDLDNDTTMTGMPFPYTRDQWRRIQRMKQCREQEEQRHLRGKRNLNIDLDALMIDAPSLRQVQVRNSRHVVPCHARKVQFDVDA